MVEMTVIYRVLVGKPGERNHLEGPGVLEKIILKLIFRKLVGGGAIH